MRGRPTENVTRKLKYKGKEAILDTAKAVKNIKERC